MRWGEIPVMTFPIKKRINTERIIERAPALYIQRQIRDEISKGLLTSGFSELEGQVCLALKRCRE